MADSILKLKVQSEEYDAKLKKAVEGIRHLAEVAHRGAGELTGLDQAELDYVRSLGEMETKSRTAAGSVRELESAYKELKVIYDKLNDVEKNDEAGKAIAASLDSIKGRAQEARAQLDSASRSLQDNGQTAQQTGGIIGELSSKLGISITKLAGWGAAIAAAKGALDVAKDAFFASEQNIDSWGQAVEAGQAVYESFLTSINSGDISGFLSRIGQITNAAIEAYNALDQLNTQKTIQSPQVAVKQAEISRMRTMLQTGRYVAPADGRSTGGMKTGDVLTKEQLSNISKNLEQALNEVATITRSQVKTASTAIDKLYAEQAAVLGVSKQRFQQATSSWKNFQDAMGKANAYEKWRTENTTYTSQTTSTGAVIRTANYDDSKNPYREWAWVSRFKDDGERFQRLIQEIQNRESAKSTLYSQYGQAYRRINRAEGVNPYGNGGGGSAADKTNTELKQNEAAISKLTEQYQKLATEAKTASDAQKVGITTRMEAIQGEIKLLIQRNDELKRFAAEAQGMKVSVGISSSLPELTKQLKQLQDAQGQAINNADWTSYAKQIELVQYQINAIKGQWKEGLQATFSFKADIPNVKTVTFKADDSDVLEKAREINGVKINDKTLTVTALTEDAEVALRNLDGMNPVPKFLTVMANTAEVEESLRNMGAEQIGDKTFRVTAEMAETLTQLQDVNAYTINDKTFAIDANTQAVLDKLKGVQDVVIDPKTLTVTALTEDAEVALRNLDGMNPVPKFLTVMANTAEVEESLRNMGAEQIGDKTFRVTAEMAETLTQLQDVNAYTINDKTFAVDANTQAVLDKLKGVQDVVIDPKTLTVTALTLEAYNKVQELFNGIEGSTVQFEVVPNLVELSNNNITAIISDIKKKIDGAEIGSDLYNNLTERLADATAIGNLIKLAIQNGLDTTQFDFTEFWANIIKGEDIPDTQLQSIVDRINNYLQEKHIELNLEVGTVTEKNDKEGEGENKGGKSKNSKWKKSQTDDEGNPYAVYGLGKMSNGMSSLVSSVEQLGIELPQGLKDIFGSIQAVTSILTSIMTIVEAIEMLSSATSFMPFFAQGGIIPHAAGGAFIGGSHFSGDVTPVLANAGELILNKASQGNLVSQLQSKESDGGNVAQPFITGEQIYLGLNNYLRRIGKGELLTARR